MSGGGGGGGGRGRTCAHACRELVIKIKSDYKSIKARDPNSLAVLSVWYPLVCA